MKRIISLLAIMSIALTAMAQDPAPSDSLNGWKSGGIVTLNFSQVAMNNWSAGGQNSVSGVAFFKGFANYTQGKANWDNTLNLGYGLQKIGKDEWFKNDDRLEFATKYGHKTKSNWYYSALLDFKTQFSRGYDADNTSNLISNFFAPAYMNIGLGMDYKPNDKFTAFLSPVTGKLTFVTDTALSNKGSFGLDAGNQFRAEFGAYVKLAYKQELMKNVTYVTKLDLFSNYFNNPQNVDVNWDNLVIFKINEYFNASVMFNLIYDDDILFDIDDNGDGNIDKHIPQLQWKEMFGLGLTYSFK
jgi:hypothetical protein